MRWLCALLLVLVALPLAAQERVALARVDLEHSALSAEGRDRGKPRPIELRLAMSQPVPYRVYFLDAPARLVVDFREVDFAGANPDALAGRELVPALRWGRARPGWSRLVMELPGPYALETAILRPAGAGEGLAHLDLRLAPVGPQEFVTRGDGATALRDLPEPAKIAPIPRRPVDRPLRIALDPGHGGHDPGSEVGVIREAAVMLGFARELAEVLTRAGYEVVMTRKDDSFIALENRMTMARAAEADLFISLHADALPEGEAAGLSIYYWDQHSNDRASRQLALRHDRADLLAGLDLTGTDDEVADVLMDLARLETHPRSEGFAKTLAAALNQSGLAMHRHPVKGAAFSVLKSPDIPSVLVELGFLTDATDRGNLFDPEWRRYCSQSIARAISEWARDDAVRSGLLRR